MRRFSRMAGKGAQPAPPRPRIIAIQSQVVHGSVGHGAALFPLQLLGCDVAAVPTVILSNHPHYPTLHGGPLPAETVAALLQGALERGYVQPGSIIHSGSLGPPAIARVVERFVELVSGSCRERVCTCGSI